MEALPLRGDGAASLEVYFWEKLDVFEQNPELQNLLLDDFFTSAVANCQDSWRQVISTRVQADITHALLHYFPRLL